VYQIIGRGVCQFPEVPLPRHKTWKCDIPPLKVAFSFSCRFFCPGTPPAGRGTYTAGQVVHITTGIDTIDAAYALPRSPRRRNPAPVITFFLCARETLARHVRRSAGSRIKKCYHPAGKQIRGAGSEACAWLCGPSSGVAPSFPSRPSRAPAPAAKPRTQPGRTCPAPKRDQFPRPEIPRPAGQAQERAPKPNARPPPVLPLKLAAAWLSLGPACAGSRRRPGIGSEMGQGPDPYKSHKDPQ
jgi:hypothetical protein